MLHFKFEVLKALALLCKSKEKKRGFIAVLSGYLVGRSDSPAVGTDSRAEVILLSNSLQYKTSESKGSTNWAVGYQGSICLWYTKYYEHKFAKKKEAFKGQLPPFPQDGQ
eukprot:3384616-Rhodomonas_salina.1